jgi:predicted nucleic acid-binding OB-fold protein
LELDKKAMKKNLEERKEKKESFEDIELKELFKYGTVCKTQVINIRK